MSLLRQTKYYKGHRTHIIKGLRRTLNLLFNDREDIMAIDVLVLPLVIVAAVVFTEAYKCLLFLVCEVSLVSELGTGGALGRVCADGRVRVSPRAGAAAGGPQRVSGRHPRVSRHQSSIPGTFL